MIIKNIVKLICKERAIKENKNILINEIDKELLKVYTIKKTSKGINVIVNIGYWFNNWLEVSNFLKSLTEIQNIRSNEINKYLTERGVLK